MKGSRPPAASQAAAVQIETCMLEVRLSASRIANGPNEHFFAPLLAPPKRTCVRRHGGEIASSWTLSGSLFICGPANQITATKVTSERSPTARRLAASFFSRTPQTDIRRRRGPFLKWLTRMPEDEVGAVEAPVKDNVGVDMCASDRARSRCPAGDLGLVTDRATRDAVCAVSRPPVDAGTEGGASGIMVGVDCNRAMTNPRHVRLLLSSSK